MVVFKIEFVKKILYLIISLFFSYSYSQYDHVLDKIFKTKKQFKIVNGTFFENIEFETINGERYNYSYTFSDKSLQLKYIIPKESQQEISECDSFSIYGKTFNLKNIYENNFACNIDVNSIKVFKGLINKKDYILLTCINNGSGAYATSVICILFDITNINDIKFYPLWSKYGGVSNIGDFNNDGDLDFIKIRQEKNSNILLLSFISIIDNKIVELKENYMRSKYKKNKIVMVNKH